jgi:hypothetical protein
MREPEILLLSTINVPPESHVWRHLSTGYERRKINGYRSGEERGMEGRSDCGSSLLLWALFIKLGTTICTFAHLYENIVTCYCLAQTNTQRFKIYALTFHAFNTTAEANRDGALCPTAWLDCANEFCNTPFLVTDDVFTAVPMKNAVFWDVTPCGSCKNRRFGGT